MHVDIDCGENDLLIERMLESACIISVLLLDFYLTSASAEIKMVKMVNFKNPIKL